MQKAHILHQEFLKEHAKSIKRIDQDDSREKLSVLNLHEDCQQATMIILKVVEDLVFKYQSHNLGMNGNTAKQLNKQVQVQKMFKNDLFNTMETIKFYEESIRNILINDTMIVLASPKLCQEIQQLMQTVNKSHIKIIKFLEECLRDHLLTKIKHNQQLEQAFRKNEKICEICHQNKENEKIKSIQSELFHGQAFARNLLKGNFHEFLQQKGNAYSANHNVINHIDFEVANNKLAKISADINQQYICMTQCIEEMNAIQQHIVKNDQIQENLNYNMKLLMPNDTNLNNVKSLPLDLTAHYNKVMIKISVKLNELIQKFHKKHRKSTHIDWATQTDWDIRKYIQTETKKIVKHNNQIVEKKEVEIQSLKKEIEKDRIVIKELKIENIKNQGQLKEKQEKIKVVVRQRNSLLAKVQELKDVMVTLRSKNNEDSYPQKRQSKNTSPIPKKQRFVPDSKDKRSENKNEKTTQNIDIDPKVQKVSKLKRKRSSIARESMQILPKFKKKDQSLKSIEHTPSVFSRNGTSKQHRKNNLSQLSNLPQQPRNTLTGESKKSSSLAQINKQQKLEQALQVLGDQIIDEEKEYQSKEENSNSNSRQMLFSSSNMITDHSSLNPLTSENLKQTSQFIDPIKIIFDSYSSKNRKILDLEQFRQNLNDFLQLYFSNYNSKQQQKMHPNETIIKQFFNQSINSYSMKTKARNHFHSQQKISIRQQNSNPFTTPQNYTEIQSNQQRDQINSGYKTSLKLNSKLLQSKQNSRITTVRQWIAGGTTQIVALSQFPQIKKTFLSSGLNPDLQLKLKSEFSFAKNALILFNKQDLISLYFSEERAKQFQEQEHKENIQQFQNPGQRIAKGNHNYLNKQQIKFSNQLLSILAYAHIQCKEIYENIKAFLTIPYNLVVLQAKNNELDIKNHNLKGDLYRLIFLHRSCNFNRSRSSRDQVKIRKSGQAKEYQICYHLKLFLEKLENMFEKKSLFE